MRGSTRSRAAKNDLAMAKTQSKRAKRQIDAPPADRLARLQLRGLPLGAFGAKIRTGQLDFDCTGLSLKHHCPLWCEGQYASAVEAKKKNKTGAIKVGIIKPFAFDGRELFKS